LSNKVTNDLLFLSIEELGQLYRKKHISPVEVTKGTINRLEELEPKLNAFITVLAEQALEQAALAEKAFLKGEEVGKLFGVPVSIKDLFYTKGIRTSLGSRIMQDFIPEEDAYVYHALKNAGAIIIGKNNMLEFAYGSVHPDYGQCNNPWDLTRTAGGSSSGSASSVAAGIGYASLGTDTGGSIRVPAAFCGIVGLKPTYETVSRQGLFPLSNSLDHIGPLTRTVRDNAIVLEQISTKCFDYDSIFTGSISGIKIGVIQSLTDSITHPEILGLTREAITTLKELGGDIVEVNIPSIETIESFAIPIILAEASTYHKQCYPDREKDYALGTAANLKAGYGITAVSYVEAIMKKHEFTSNINKLFEQVDLLLCPTVPYPATEKDPSFEDGNIDISQRTIPFNLTGHPAMSISAGNTASQNLPVGLQMIGRHHDESLIYKVADAYQRATGGYRRPNLQ
jgi:aspartyl-tRNA(Asn)/glutamyl-tRNA(Gln) amidotransferase subunit A